MTTKDDYLRETGSFNGNYTRVTANIFNTSPFFDKKDIVQVKYEMLRSVSEGEGNVTEIASAYGFSRKSYYQASAAFDSEGLGALVPKKTGPKGPSKLSPEVLGFIEAFSEAHRDAKSSTISTALEAKLGVKIHPRTIYRHLKKN